MGWERFALVDGLTSDCGSGNAAGVPSEGSVVFWAFVGRVGSDKSAVKAEPNSSAVVGLFRSMLSVWILYRRGADLIRPSEISEIERVLTDSRLALHTSILSTLNLLIRSKLLLLVT